MQPQIISNEEICKRTTCLARLVLASEILDVLGSPRGEYFSTVWIAQRLRTRIGLVRAELVAMRRRGEISSRRERLVHAPSRFVVRWVARVGS